MNSFSNILQEHVNSSGGIGISARIVHQGADLFRGAAGYADLKTKRPFSCENIIRIFSLTKMITAVAALQLYEEGAISLDDRVAKFLPAFENATVLTYDGGGLPVVKPAEKSLTVRHLFTMTAGYAYPGVLGMADTPRNYLDASRYTTEVFKQCAAEERGQGLTTRRMAAAIASIPMAFEPGEGYIYGLSADLLGAVVNAVSGLSLGEYMRNFIFEPLGMRDTSFYPALEQMPRTVVTYNLKDPRNIKPFDFERDLTTSVYRGRDSELEICVGGLYSTLDDYSAFMQMLAGGGSLNGTRILGRKTVELMTMDHLTEKQYEDFRRMASPRGNASWGLMTRVTTSIKDSPHAFFPGVFGWGGAGGALAVADPKENLTITLMTQKMPSLNSYPTLNKLAQAAYATLQ